MEDQRRHPDLFSAEEAAQYLHLPSEQTCTIENFRKKGSLMGFLIGKEFFYHRRELDSLIENMSRASVNAAIMERSRASQALSGPRLRLPPAGATTSNTCVAGGER